MVERLPNESDFDASFQALADPTRRAFVGRFGGGLESGGKLATPQDTVPRFWRRYRSHQQALEGSPIDVETERSRRAAAT